MCNNVDALKKLIDEALILDGTTGLTLTGWDESEDNYDRGTLTNRVTTDYGIVRGGISIAQGGGMNNAFGRFGGFRDREDNRQEVTIERLRGILVTALAVAHTDAGRTLVSGFAATVEALASNCFQPVSYDLTVGAGGDAVVIINMTNGLTSVRMEVKANDESNQKIELDLPTKYILGTGFVSVLLGKNDRGYSGTGLSVLENGKWVRLTGISAREFDPEETVNVDELSVDEVVQLVGEARRPLVQAALVAIIRQLNTLGGFVHVYEVSVAHGDYRSTPSLVVHLADSKLRKRYGLEFTA
ncbi:hypothetical protein MZD04_gp018 [Pseudomonas phage Psa21]|uniref:Uncharacterized protein n=1 Tax=Pseudomonas phage Psa21 TaxID=2530023 RepID=A0A481W4L7_9CAUD|nr:hypothetical protein MZD04_gp018 [Pseudomonas phage Psa21]QBJ02548.1 hypothetical protein PSA21_18 [Pseudomonas phage Psa21]